MKLFPGQGWILLTAGMLAAAPAPAAPVQATTPRFTFTLPEGFRPQDSAAATKASPVYVRYDLGHPQPDSWLHVQEAGAPPDNWTESRERGRLLDSYTETWGDYRVSIRSFEVSTGTVRQIEKSVRIPLRPRPVDVSLRSETMKDEEMRRTLRDVLQTIELRSPDESAGAPPWVKAMVYLALGAVVIIVGIAGARGR